MSKRTRLLSLLALALSGSGSPASAQPTPPDPAAPPVTPTEPTPPTDPTPPTVVVVPKPVEAKDEMPTEPPKKEEKKDEAKPLVHSKWDATLYGFAELDVINDSTQGLGELAGGALIARPNTYAGDHGQT